MKRSLIITLIITFLLIANGCSSTTETPARTPSQTGISTTEEDTADTTSEEAALDTIIEDTTSVEDSASEEDSPPSSEPSTPEVVTEPEELPSGYIVDKEICFENSQIEVYYITYMSDGLRVKGYLAQPKAPGVYPAIIYNRGGNLEFGKLTCLTLQVYATNGFVAIGSQYRGNDGGEGMEEFGGEDIHDVMNLIPVLKTLSNVDATKIGMVGYSRGGMMTYLALKEQTLRGIDDIRVACTVGGTADLFINAENRDDMLYGVFIPLIGGTPDEIPEEYEARSATYWADKINVPLLIQHGESDWRVLVDESEKLAGELDKYGKEYELITYPGDDHSLSLHNGGLYEIFSWLSEHLDISVSPLNISTSEYGGSYYYPEGKGYKITVPYEGWSVNMSSPPLDVTFTKVEGEHWGCIGSGAFGGAIYSTSYFDGINESWISDISQPGWGYTNIQVIEEGVTCPQ